MSKIITILVIAIAVVAAYLFFFPLLSQAPDQAQPEAAPELTQEEQDKEFCIQVITPARNPSTGEIVEFPTPCDVPDGWEPVTPEGLDLQVI